MFEHHIALVPKPPVQQDARRITLEGLLVELGKEAAYAHPGVPCVLVSQLPVTRYAPHQKSHVASKLNAEFSNWRGVFSAKRDS